MRPRQYIAQSLPIAAPDPSGPAAADTTSSVKLAGALTQRLIGSPPQHLLPPGVRVVQADRSPAPYIQANDLG